MFQHATCELHRSQLTLRCPPPPKPSSTPQSPPSNEHALRRNDVDWDKVEPETRARASSAEETKDVYPAIKYLLRQLGDRHSHLRTPSQMNAFTRGGSVNPIPEVRSLPDGIGYISVSGYSGAEPGAIREYARRVHEAIAATSPSVSCGWVVDLRSNTGGNMWPMLAGLKPFLGGAGLGHSRPLPAQVRCGTRGRMSVWSPRGPSKLSRPRISRS